MDNTWAIATILAGFSICQPITYNWDQSIPSGLCGNQVLSFMVTGTINLIMDVIVLGLPMPMLYKLQMATNKQLSCIIVLGLGFM